MAGSILARTIALTPMGRACVEASGAQGPRDFSVRALEALGVSADLRGEGLRRVPACGPLVIVANHPFGLLDGLLLLSVIGRVRSDLKLLGNRLLLRVRGLRPCLLGIDVFGGRRAVGRNALALRQALRWLEGGGCVLLFPAGEVAHHAEADGSAVDSEWHPTAAELAVRARAPVVPVFFSGSNSRLFHAAGRVHPLLRTALLPREMWAKRGSTIEMEIGGPVDADALSRLGSPRERTEFLRARVTQLASRSHVVSGLRWTTDVVPGCHRTAGKTVVPIAPRGRAENIAADVAALQSEVLLESGSYQVFCTAAARLPAVLPEIGRLREMAFRQAGEGTGLARDLDRFDDTYQHLFVWDRVRREVAGAYRVGATDVVAAGGRVHELYTRTLFDYDASLLEQIGPALELGRSFVSPGYQRDFSPLLLLWKGISRMVSRSPRYRRLFGVVSISDRYDPVSRQLLVKFLHTTRFDADLGRFVHAKNPPAPPVERLVRGAAVSSLEEVSSLIRRIEADGKDIPVLLRHYLKLNAKLLGFSVDPAFGNVLDGLVIVDLAEVEPAILSRYMGREGSERFVSALKAS